MKEPEATVMRNSDLKAEKEKFLLLTPQPERML